MYAVNLGLPLAIIVFVIVINFVNGLINAPVIEFLAAVAAFAGVLRYFASYDAKINKIIDNPPDRTYQLSMPEAWSIIADRLENLQLGPYSWKIKKKDQSRGLIQAELHFSETVGKKEIQKSIQLVITVTGAESGSLVQSAFYVRSPSGRVLATKYVEATTVYIRQILEDTEPYKPQYTMENGFRLLNKSAIAPIAALGLFYVWAFTGIYPWLWICRAQLWIPPHCALKPGSPIWDNWLWLFGPLWNQLVSNDWVRAIIFLVFWGLAFSFIWSGFIHAGLNTKTWFKKIFPFGRAAASSVALLIFISSVLPGFAQNDRRDMLQAYTSIIKDKLLRRFQWIEEHDKRQFGVGVYNEPIERRIILHTGYVNQPAQVKAESAYWLLATIIEKHGGYEENARIHKIEQALEMFIKRNGTVLGRQKNIYGDWFSEYLYDGREYLICDEQVEDALEIVSYDTLKERLSVFYINHVPEFASLGRFQRDIWLYEAILDGIKNGYTTLPDATATSSMWLNIYLNRLAVMQGPVEGDFQRLYPKVQGEVNQIVAQELYPTTLSIETDPSYDPWFGPPVTNAGTKSAAPANQTTGWLQKLDTGTAVSTPAQSDSSSVSTNQNYSNEIPGRPQMENTTSGTDNSSSVQQQPSQLPSDYSNQRVSTTGQTSQESRQGSYQLPLSSSPYDPRNTAPGLKQLKVFDDELHRDLGDPLYGNKGLKPAPPGSPNWQTRAARNIQASTPTQDFSNQDRFNPNNANKEQQLEPRIAFMQKHFNMLARKEFERAYEENLSDHWKKTWSKADFIESCTGTQWLPIEPLPPNTVTIIYSSLNECKVEVDYRKLCNLDKRAIFMLKNENGQWKLFEECRE